MAKSEIINNDALTVRVNKEPVQTILEEATNHIEDTLDILENQVERVVTVTKNNPFVVAAAFAIGIGIGGFAAYKYAEKRTTLKYEEILENEIEAARVFYKRLAKEGEYDSPESTVAVLIPEEAADALTTYQGRERIPYEKTAPATPEETIVEATVERATVQVTNVFASAVDPRDWDYQAEIQKREESPGEPYVISFEEFEENADANEQATLTYYSGDDTLADDKDQPIDNTNYTVGDDNLIRFGAGSNDGNVVYIRNERLGMDFEVNRSPGSYSQEVLGIMSGELSHSRHPNRSRNSSTPRRFRERDDE